LDAFAIIFENAVKNFYYKFNQIASIKKIAIYQTYDFVTDFETAADHQSKNPKSL